MLNAYCTFRLLLKVSLLQGVYTLLQPELQIVTDLHSVSAFLCVAAAFNRRRCIKFRSWPQLIELSLSVVFTASATSSIVVFVLSFHTLFTHEVREGYPLNLSI